MEHSLSLNNRQWNKLATAIEVAEDRDALMKKLWLDRQAVIDIVNDED